MEGSFDIGAVAPEPFSFELSKLRQEISELPARMARGDSHRALMRADLLALAALEQFKDEDLQSLQSDALEVLKT